MLDDGELGGEGFEGGELGVLPGELIGGKPIVPLPELPEESFEKLGVLLDGALELVLSLSFAFAFCAGVG